MLTVHQLTVGSLEENTYAVVNEAGQALLIDPGADAPKILDWIVVGMGQKDGLRRPTLGLNPVQNLRRVSPWID